MQKNNKNDPNLNKKIKFDGINPPKKNSSTPGVIILSLLCIIIFLIVILLMYKVNIIPMPKFLSNLLSKEETEPQNSFRNDFFAVLENVPDSSPEAQVPASGKTEIERILIDEEMLTQLIFDSNYKSSSYIQHLSIKYMSSKIEGEKISSSKDVAIYCYGERFRIEIMPQIDNKKFKIDTKIIICDGKNIIHKNLSTNKNQLYKKGTFTLYDEAGIPDTEYVMDLLSTANNNNVISNYKIELVQSNLSGDNPNSSYNFRSYVTVRFDFENTAVSEVYDIDLESGILKSVSSSKNGEVYYTVNTKFLNYTDLTFSDNFFKAE